MKITDIKLNPNNPRKISTEKMDQLKKSIKDFEKMLRLRPIIIDENNMVLGGNMRTVALQELGYDEIPEDWVKKETGLTEDEKREFIIKDNIPFGENDWEALAEWDQGELESWGMDILSFEPEFEDKELDGEMKAKDKVICPNCGLEFTP